MSGMRRVAALILGMALLVGCQPLKPEPDPTPVPAAPDRVEMLKAQYLAITGTLVGEVDAVLGGMAAVSGIDGKALAKDDVLTFVDPSNNEVVSHGLVAEVRASGRLVVKFDEKGKRAPQPGDLAVRLK